MTNSSVDSGFPTDPAAPRAVAPPGEPFAPGQVVAGRYEILERLGAGGMGTVYRVRDRTLHEDVALKALHVDRLGTAADRERFLREARLARRITHPGVCRVFDVGEDGGVPFLTMELVAGKPLRALLQAGPIPLAQALRLWEQIARGVAAAHEQGIIHRDIKPENVLIQPDGHVKVADFGLASGIGADATSTGAGTPPYMSPEQLSQDVLDAQSDVFSLGVLGHEMISGTHPFGTGAAAVVTSAILRDAPLPIAVPRPVAAVLGRAMAKQRHRRFASASELADAIAALPGASVSGLFTTIAERKNRPLRAVKRRFRILAVAALLGALVMVAATRLPPRTAQSGTPLRVSTTEVLSGPSSPRIAVAPFRDAAGTPWSGELARAAEETTRTALGQVRGVSLDWTPVATDWLVTGSIQNSGKIVRVQVQIEREPGRGGDPFEVEGTNDTLLLDALRDRVIDEARILVRDHDVRTRAMRGTSNDSARKDLLAYHDLIGPSPRPEHVAAGMPLLDAALEADPDYVPARVARAHLLLLRASLGARREDLQAARVDVDAAHARAPDDLQTAALLCRWARFATTFETSVSDEAVDAAFDACNAALRLDPASARVHVELAKLHDLVCDQDQALQILEAALPLDRSKAAEILRYRAELAFQTDRIQLANELTRTLVRLQEEEERLGPRSLAARAGVPPIRGAHWLRGSVLLRLGALDEARANLEHELGAVARTGADAATEAAILRGLMRASPPGERARTALEPRLHELESRFAAEAAREPSIALGVAGAYMFTDPRAALGWLRRLGHSTACSEARHRALVHHVAGDNKGARRALSTCKPATRWEARCVAMLDHRIHR